MYSRSFCFRLYKQNKRGELTIIWYKKLEINLGNIKKNLKVIKNFLPADTQILPVIKNDAYGHGLLKVAHVLSEEKVFGFGLSEPEEALILRKEGFSQPILLLSGFEKDWLSEMYNLEITPIVTSLNTFEWLRNFVKSRNVKWKFHLKVDTGMHRFGIDLEELDNLIKKIKDSPYLFLEGIMTHLSCSEKPEHKLTQTQLENLKKALEKLKINGINPKYVHFANSGSIIFLTEKGNLVRPGISIYGGYPSFKARELVKLYPVMTLKSRIVEIKKIKKGEYAGYGPNFRAKKDTILGLIPVGYGDGYPKILSNRGFAYYKGKKVNVVGNVSMKVLYLDITDVENPQIGDEVILLGGENEEVPADKLAELAETISYELFCNLGRSIPREYRYA